MGKMTAGKLICVVKLVNLMNRKRVEGKAYNEHLLLTCTLKHLYIKHIRGINCLREEG